MSMIEFTDSELKIGALVDPGMYNVNIVKFTEGVGGGEPLYKYQYEIFGHENPEFNGIRLFDQFSAKAMGFYIPFWEAVTGARPVKGQQYDLNYPVGKSIRVSVKRGVWENKPKNEVNGYAPLSA